MTILQKVAIQSMLLGGLIGIVIGLKLARLSDWLADRRRRTR